MPADPFVIKQNDRRKLLVRTLRNADQTPIDLTGATVLFHMRLIGATTLKVNAAATITNATGGIVQYAWAAGDTDTVGKYEAEFQVTFADATILTVPNDGHMTVTVTDELG